MQPTGRAADRAGRLLPVLRRRDGGDRDLGGAVQVVDDRPEQLHRAGADVGRQGRAGAEDDPQRGRVVAADDVLAEVEDALQHGRDDHELLDPVLRQHLEGDFGSNRRRTIVVEPSEIVSRNWDSPVPWNSGAPRKVRSPGRSGIRSMNCAAENGELTCRGAPFGVPVVPLVSRTRPPGSFGAWPGDSSPAAIKLARCVSCRRCRRHRPSRPGSGGWTPARRRGSR